MATTEVIDNPVMLAYTVDAFHPAEKELQLDIPSRTILRSAENKMMSEDWSYPNFRTTVAVGRQDYVAWGWKLRSDRCWGFLVVPMTWVLRRGPGAGDELIYFARADPDRDGQMLIVIDKGRVTVHVVAGSTRQSRGHFYETLRDMIRVRA